MGFFYDQSSYSRRIFCKLCYLQLFIHTQETYSLVDRCFIYLVYQTPKKRSALLLWHTSPNLFRCQAAKVQLFRCLCFGSRDGTAVPLPAISSCWSSYKFLFSNFSWMVTLVSMWTCWFGVVSCSKNYIRKPWTQEDTKRSQHCVCILVSFVFLFQLAIADSTQV